MSFAYSAALVDDNSNNINDSDNYLNKKKQSITHNKTQKNYYKENFDTGKVNSVLEALHKNQKVDDDENKSTLGNFNPPANPVSSGVNKTIATEQMMNMTIMVTVKPLKNIIKRCCRDIIIHQIIIHQIIIPQIIILQTNNITRCLMITI